MTGRFRLGFFVVSAIGFLAVYLLGLRGLPPLGHYQGPYGNVVNATATYERHVTDIVSAVNFDYRGFDTLGEEFILFISVVGVSLLLRKGGESSKHTQKRPAPAPRAANAKDGEEGEDKQDEARERHVPSPSDAVRVFTLGLVGPLVLFGIYIVVHGHLTPGGGFQGGVILATAPLLVYLAGDFRTFKRIVSHSLIELSDGTAAAGYALIGVAGMVIGGRFLQNVVPLGVTGNVNSGGTIALIDLAVGLEVASAFVLLLFAFLEETLARYEERENP